MRNVNPSRNWMQRAIISYAQHGGWCGDATLREARREMADLYRRGVPASAAGYVSANTYRMLSDLAFSREGAEAVR